MAQIVCPDCASPQVHASRRGFSGGLGLLGVVLFGFIGFMFGGIIGSILLGGLGMFNGFIGAGEIQLTCLSCGTKGVPGK